jgi:hypothetical protein
MINALIKRITTSSSSIRKFRRDRVQVISEDFLIYEEKHKYLTIYEEVIVSLTELSVALSCAQLA